MQFTSLRAAIIKEYDTKLAEWLVAFSGEEKTEGMSYTDILLRWASPAIGHKFNAGKVGIESLKKSAITCCKNDYAQRTEEALTKIERAENARGLINVSISVEWHKHRYDGMCPIATVAVLVAGERPYREGVYTGAARGGNYDKLSAAIASAMNQSPAIMRVLYAKAEELKGEQAQYREKIGYGSGYSILPYFEGGVGVSCYRSIFETLGYEWKYVASGKTFDVFSVEKV